MQITIVLYRHMTEEEEMITIPTTDMMDRMESGNFEQYIL
jgi:hypothetical protein